jgi:hypothetical protein
MKKKQILNVYKVFIVLASCLLATVLAQPETLITLELTGGGQSYSVQTGEEAACTQHVAEDGDLWYEYDPGGSYTGVNIIVPNLEEAKSPTSTFGFGIDSQAVHGYGDDGGNLTAVQEGNVVTLELNATSADGIAMSAIATCLVP